MTALNINRVGLNPILAHKRPSGFKYSYVIMIAGLNAWEKDKHKEAIRRLVETVFKPGDCVLKNTAPS